MEEPLDIIAEKPKKPRSEAQIKAFELAREKRINNATLKKEMIADVKEKIKSGITLKIESKPEAVELEEPQTPVRKIRKVIEEEEEIVYVKRKPKKIIFAYIK